MQLSSGHQAYTFSWHCYRIATAIDYELMMNLSFELSKLLYRILRIL